MKRKLIGCIVLVIIMAISISGVIPASARNEGNNITAFSSDKALEARFLNMLNHNFVYDDAFYSQEKIANESVIAILGMRDSEDDEFIKESYVSEFIYNMYGIEIDDFSQFNSDMPKRSGYFYIIPRGFTAFSHSIESVTENEDGTYTVITNMTADYHDDDAEILSVKTLFVKNETSSFGFNIVNSRILDEASSL